MNKKQFILQLKKIDYERKIEKLNSSMDSENKKSVRKIINKLKNELNNINYELEEILGGIR